MRNNIPLPNCAITIIQILRQQLTDPGFLGRHRRRAQDFTRECALTFPVLMLLLLQKTLKSLQTHLHEFLWELARGADARQVGPGALTHARAKLLPSAFVELNEAVVLRTFYGRGHAAQVQRWCGHRLLGIDSSLVRLPESQELRQFFGVVQCGNQHGNHESFPEARGSVLYDLLNQLAVDARLVSSTVPETELACQHLDRLEEGDVAITDRGYSGYRWFVQVRHRERHFISRCSRASFAIVQRLFARNEAGLSVIVTLRAPKEVRAECRQRGWPLELPVRLVTIRLTTGELEVLATSLLDETAYPTEEFGAVYWRRWGHETYYGKLKGRLDWEHFSGQTVEAVQQDFAALILLSNLESVVIRPAQAELAERSQGRTQPVQVNHAVSLHAIKSRLIELLASSVPVEEVLTQLTQWFVHNPTSVRPGRKVRRRKFSPSRSYHYQRRVRKIVF